MAAGAFAAVPPLARGIEDAVRASVPADTEATTAAGTTDAMDTAVESPLAYLGEDLDSNPVWELRGQWGQVAIPEGWRDVTADALEEDPHWYEDYLGGAWAMDGSTWDDSYEWAQLMIYADDAETASMTLDEVLNAYYVDESSGYVPSEVTVGETSLGYEQVIADFSDASQGNWLVLLRKDGIQAEFSFVFDPEWSEYREDQMESVVASFRFSD